MTAILACSQCHSGIRSAGTGTCPSCEGRAETQPEHNGEHCARCGLGWRPLNEHHICPTCAATG